MENTFISQVVKVIETETPLKRGDALELALQLLAWAKLSTEQKLSPELNLDLELIVGYDEQRIQETSMRIAEENPGLIRTAFSETKLKGLDTRKLMPAFELSAAIAASGVLRRIKSAHLMQAVLSVDRKTSALPNEVVQLMVELAGLREQDRVYLPWDHFAQFAIESTGKQASAYLEIPTRSTLPALVGILLEREFELTYADPILSPSNIENGGLNQFDVAIAFPLPGVRYSRKDLERDWFQRFPPRFRGSAAALTIYHLLAQARRTIVVAVPDALLFGAMDAELRRELVQSGRLDLVLSLAAGILPTTNASFSILRLSPDGGSGGGRVRFINGQSDNLTGRTFNPRSRPQLINLETLLALSHSEEESSVCSSSSIDEILSNDAQLQTSQYILSEQQKRLRQDLQQKETVELGVLARIIQPAFRRIAADMPEEHITMIREVALSDIPEYGYIQKASRENPIDTRSKKNLNLNTLQPGDIIVTTKGTVGKVGMLPENSARLDEKPWAVGQSAVALRVHSDAPIDSKTLFMLLRSPLGQEILKQHITGATMPLISTSQLRRVRLPIPSAHEQKQALAALEQEEALQREIEQLRQRQMQAAEQLWRID